MDWLAKSLSQPFEEDGIGRRQEPAASHEGSSQEAADWHRGVESRQWELAFKLESLTMQYEQLDTVQREQAVQIEQLSSDLQECMADRDELRGQLEESREVALGLQAENQRLHQALKKLLAALPMPASALRRADQEADSGIDLKRGLALPADSGLPERQKGKAGVWPPTGGRAPMSAGCVSNASTVDSSGHAGSSSDGPLAR